MIWSSRLFGVKWSVHPHSFYVLLCLISISSHSHAAFFMLQHHAPDRKRISVSNGNRVQWNFVRLFAQYDRYRGSDWWIRSNWLIILICVGTDHRPHVRCGPQPLQRISASWYRPVHHLGARALRSSDAPMLVVPRIHTELARRAFSVAAPSTWNSLPADIRLCKKHSHFQTPTENPSVQTHLVLLCCIKHLCTSDLKALYKSVIIIIIIIIIIDRSD